MWSEALKRLMARALSEGATYQAGLPNRVQWDCYGTCITPSSRELHARDTDAKPNGYRFTSPGWAGTLIMRVPCRRCEGCLRYKAWLWRRRATAETTLAPRTWMGSFTYNPEEHFQALLRIRSALRSAAVDPDTLTEVELFKARTADMGAAATRYFKRLRKHKAVFRYLLVTEAHKSGLPHLHVLLHEADHFQPVRKRLLQEQWPHGFTNFKLVEDGPKATYYVTKYLAKGMLSRVRASQHYGNGGKSPLGIVGLRMADVIAGHLFENGNLDGLELHRFI